MRPRHPRHNPAPTRTSAPGVPSVPPYPAGTSAPPRSQNNVKNGTFPRPPQQPPASNLGPAMYPECRYPSPTPSPDQPHRPTNPIARPTPYRSLCSSFRSSRIFGVASSRNCSMASVACLASVAKLVPAVSMGALNKKLRPRVKKLRQLLRLALTDAPSARHNIRHLSP